MSKTELIEKFDSCIESRIGIILNWFWKSGLFGILILMLMQNLSVQKENSNHVVSNNMIIKQLITDTKIMGETSKEHAFKIIELESCTQSHTTDLKYLRRDVDGIMK